MREGDTGMELQEESILPSENQSIAERKPLINPRPILFGAVGTLVGGILSLRLSPWWLLGLGMVALLLSLPLVYKRSHWCLLPLLLGLTLLRGIFLPRTALPGGTHTLSGQIISLPRSSEEGVTVELWQLSIEGVFYSGTVEATLPVGTKADYGDFVTFSASIEPKASQKVAPKQQGSATATGAVAVEPGQGFVLYGWILRLQEAIEQQAELLFSPYAGEAKGMLLGQKEDISYTSYRSFVNSGLVHLLTVSGLHVGILCNAVLKLIRGRKQWLRGLLAGSMLLIYTALTGFSPSTLRAAIMVFVLFIMRTSGRQEDSLGALALSFSLLVLADPRYLTSLGFQLSYGSVWGLFMLSEPIARILPGERNPMWEAVAASLGATLGTVPLLASTTGQVQWVGLLLSPAVIPVAAIFLVPGWIAIGLSVLWTPLGELVALLPRGALIYIVKAAELGTSMPLIFPQPDWLVQTLWFVGLFCLSPYFLPNEKRPPWVGYGLIGASLLWWIVIGG